MDKELYGPNERSLPEGLNIRRSNLEENSLLVPFVKSKSNVSEEEMRAFAEHFTDFLSYIKGVRYKHDLNPLPTSIVYNIVPSNFEGPPILMTSRAHYVVSSYIFGDPKEISITQRHEAGNGRILPKYHEILKHYIRPRR